MEADIDQIVVEVRAGRTEAYAGIVARYQQEIWRIAARLLVDRDATGDLVQQVFVDAYFHLGQYQTGTDFGAWLRSIARNRVRREARSAARASRRLEAYRRLLLDRLDDSPEVERQEQALRDALRECQEKLSAPAARVLGLRYVECLGFDDIAARVGGSGAAVQRMISRIRLQLRDCIKLKVALRMTRIELLTLKLLDQTISEAEAEELERLVERSGPGVNDHFLLLDIEALLRGQRACPDLSAQVMDRLGSELAAQTPREVLRTIAGLPAPAWKQSPPPPGRLRRWRITAPLGIVALAASVVVLAIGLFAFRQRLAARPEAAETDPRMRVVDLRGQLEILTPGLENRIARLGQRVAPGQTLRTSGEESFAVVEFADRTRLDLSPSSIVRLVAAERHESGAGKRVVLSSGVLRADASRQRAGQSLVVQTPVAEVRVAGAASFLSVTTADCTWVDLENGRAEMVRRSDGRQIEIGAGSSATVRADLEEMVPRPWQHPRPAPRARLDFVPAHALGFSADGSTLLAANSRRLLRYSLETGEQHIDPIPGPGHDGTRATLSRDGGSLALSAPDGLSVWDTLGMHQRLAIPVAGLPTRPVALAADGSWLAAQDGDPGRTAGLFFWDVASGQERGSWLVDGPVRNLASSSDGGVLIVGTKESPEAPTHRILLWDLPPTAPAVTLVTDLPASWQVVLAPDGQRLATVGRDGVVQIWQVPTRSIERVIDVRERPVRSLAFSPDGRLLAGGTLYGSVMLWDVETGQERSELKADQRGVRLLAFAPDGKTLATGTLDEPILLWDVPGPPAPESERPSEPRPSLPGENQE